MEIKKSDSNRLFEVDCVKFFAIFFMICIHVYEQLGRYDFSVLPNGMFRNLMEFAGGPLAAPIFMFTMGIGMIYTRHNTVGEFIKRGFKLLLIGFALNFVREAVPKIIGNLAFGMEFSFDEIMGGFLNIDILEFAGMSFITVGILKKAKVKAWAMLLISVVLQAAGIWALKYTFTNIVWGNLLGLLLPTGDRVAFPMFLWLVYPTAGMVFAEYLKTVKDRAVLYRRMASVGAVVLAAVSVWLCFAGHDIRMIYALADDSYYHQTVISTLWTMSVVFIALGMSYFMYGKIENTGFGKFVSFCSKKLNIIYIIQWIIIAYTTAIVTAVGIEGSLSWWGIILVGLAVEAVAIGITKIFFRKV